MTLPRALLAALGLLLLAALGLRQADALRVTLAWDPGLPLTATDGYVLARDGVEVARTAGLSLTDTLPGPGPYTYTVQAVAGGERSAPSAPLTLTAAAMPCTLLQTATQLTLTCATAPAMPPGPYPRLAVGRVTVQAVDSQDLGYEGTRAVDGLPTTFWHSNWRGPAPPLPHTLTLDLGAVLWVDGLAYLPRQDGEFNGTLTSYRVETSTDGTTWTEAVAGTWPLNATEKTVRFPALQARTVRLVGLVSNGSPYASAAEVGVYAVEGGTP
jgi:F5/8 type C domain-containing protein